MRLKSSLHTMNEDKRSMENALLKARQDADGMLAELVHLRKGSVEGHHFQAHEVIAAEGQATVSPTSNLQLPQLDTTDVVANVSSGAGQLSMAATTDDDDDDDDLLGGNAAPNLMAVSGDCDDDGLL